MPVLPLERDLKNPESLLEWVDELGVELDMREVDGFPSRPLVLSDYRMSGPVIVIYRYLPMEDWFNLLSQHHVGFYGPWYCLHIAHRLYYHLELSGEYEIPRQWYHRMLGMLVTIEDRAYHFTREVLGTLHSPRRFDQALEKAFQPATLSGKRPFA